MLVPDPVYFEFDQSVVTAIAATKLEKIVQMLHEYPEVKVKVVSYADNRGSLTYNYQLSKRRSEAIAAYIITHGKIASDRIIPIAKGAVQLTNTGAVTEKIHQRNRRTDFEIIIK